MDGEISHYDDMKTIPPLWWDQAYAMFSIATMSHQSLCAACHGVSKETDISILVYTRNQYRNTNRKQEKQIFWGTDR